MASTGGNLLQRTRCLYFYDTNTACNKREPGSGCDAIGGFNRMNAILGWSETCIAVHPSDLCVALAALEAIVHVSGSKGDRAIPFADFHRLPGDTPQIDTNLARDEIIVAIELPPEGFSSNYSYLKIRDRLSYAFALVSVAAGLKIEGGAIRDARVALGGVAHKPWRGSRRREASRGPAAQPKDVWRLPPISFCRAPTGFAHNSFKIELARRAIVRALEQAAAGTTAISVRESDRIGRRMTLPSTNSIGKPVSRVDGPAKVTGQAKYAAEFNVPGLAHGFVVSSKIAKGRIKSIDRSAALAVPGVLEVFAHDNRPNVASVAREIHGRGCLAGLALPAALRRPDPLFGTADRFGGRGRVRDRAPCGHARRYRI